MAINRRRDSKSSLNGSHGEFTGSDDVKTKGLKKFGQKAGLQLAKMAVHQALKDKRVTNVVGKGNAKALDNMVKKAVNKKLKPTGRGFYGGGRGMYKGRGSYENVVSNQLVAGSAQRPATLASSGDETGEIMVSKREYLTDMFSTGSTNFYLESFSVNPGLSGVFPFLSQIATNYTSYEFIQLIFEYVPVVSQSSTTGAMGTIILACNGNAAAGPFASKVEMNEYEGAISGRVCDHLVLGVECDPRKLGLQPTLYVRAGAVASGQDIKTYDLGLFQIGLSGVSTAAFPVGTQLGEIWVHYRLKLRKPRLYDALGFNIPRDIFYATGVGSSLTLPFGTAPLKSINNVIGCRLSKAGTSVLTFPDNFTGYVELFLAFQGTTITGGAGFATPSGQVTFVSDLATAGAASATIQLVNAGTSATQICHFFVGIATVPNGNYLTLALTGYVAPTFQLMTVSQYNPLPGYILASGSNASSMVAV